jgi:lauroyl/myristoyl acyltransferase
MTVAQSSPARTASRKQRLYASNTLHRAFPMALGYQYARVRTERWWSNDAQARADARLQMEFLAGRWFEGDLDALGKAYMFESLKREELGWRPWLMMRFPVDGIERLRAVRDAGTGGIVSFLHHGQYHGVFGSLAHHGVSARVAAAPWFVHRHAPDHAGRLNGRIDAAVTRYGVQIFDATASYASIREMLRSGALVGIAADVPGTTEVGFLGRRVSIRSGAARLAIDAGVPIIQITARRRGLTQRLQVEEPIEPGRFADFRELLGEIVARHEPAVRAWPAAFHWPLRRFNLVDAEDVAAFGFEPAEYFKRFRV